MRAIANGGLEVTPHTSLSPLTRAPTPFFLFVHHPLLLYFLHFTTLAPSSLCSSSVTPDSSTGAGGGSGGVDGGGATGANPALSGAVAASTCSTALSLAMVMAWGALVAF